MSLGMSLQKPMVRGEKAWDLGCKLKSFKPGLAKELSADLGDSSLFVMSRVFSPASKREELFSVEGKK